MPISQFARALKGLNLCVVSMRKEAEMEKGTKQTLRENYKGLFITVLFLMQVLIHGEILQFDGPLLS